MFMTRPGTIAKHSLSPEEELRSYRDRQQSDFRSPAPPRGPSQISHPLDHHAQGSRQGSLGKTETSTGGTLSRSHEPSQSSHAFDYPVQNRPQGYGRTVDPSTGDTPSQHHEAAPVEPGPSGTRDHGTLRAPFEITSENLGAILLQTARLADWFDRHPDVTRGEQVIVPFFREHLPAKRTEPHLRGWLYDFVENPHPLEVTDPVENPDHAEEEEIMVDNNGEKGKGKVKMKEEKKRG